MGGQNYNDPRPTVQQSEIVSPLPMPVNVIDTPRALFPITRFLRSTTDNSEEAIGDYSAVNQVFEYLPTGREVVTAVSIKMSGGGAFNNTEVYGNLGAALTNGILVEYQSQGIAGNPTINPIKTNWNLFSVATFGQDATFQGNVNGINTFFTFGYVESGGIIIDAANNDFVRFTLRDSFVGLTHHNFVLNIGVF